MIFLFKVITDMGITLFESQKKSFLHTAAKVEIIFMFVCTNLASKTDSNFII